jgi:hypothetical protein
MEVTGRSPLKTTGIPKLVIVYRVKPPREGDKPGSVTGRNGYGRPVPTREGERQ